jgi:hypothetical protein
MHQLNDVNFIDYFLNIGNIVEVFIILIYSLLSQMNNSKYILFSIIISVTNISVLYQAQQL